jgi:sarcosine oxidase subunit alpha
MNRLNRLPTLRIDLTKKRRLTYKNRIVSGVAGDTVATALFANGVRIFGRSLKYHRPRGLYSLDGECGNTLMEVDGIPNVCAENTLLKEGMTIKEQNVVGSASWDWMGFLDKLDHFMPPGFYYKTLHKPAVLWPHAMKRIRKVAGLGVISPDFKMTGRFEELFLTAEVTVIGGGPAGMAAALAAAESGLRVVLLESRPYLGGCFDYRVSTTKEGTPLYERARTLAKEVKQTKNIRLFEHTSMIGAYGDGLITAFEKGKREDSFTERYIEIRSQSVVVATGCTERPLIFENNERPGVMQVGCAHRLARIYGLLPGREAVFSVGHDLGLEAAVDLCDLKLKVKCVADIRKEGQNPTLLSALAERNIPVLTGWVAACAHGSKAVKKVTLATLNGMVKQEFTCDLLVASAGLTPMAGPFVLAQAEMGYDRLTGYFLPTRLPEKMFPAGRLIGINDPDAIEASGRLTGFKAAVTIGAALNADLLKAKEILKNIADQKQGCKLVTAPVKGRKSFICFDEDATVKSVKQAIQMGFDIPELIKRFAGVGLGPGQSGIPGHNLPLFVAQHTAFTKTPKPTTVRPPLVPTFISTYAGFNHHMFKRTPLHRSQKADGGIFRNIGVWKRARYFSKDFSCKEEILNVRNNVGMLDGSTLGKFRIHGPDALEALQRVYVSDMSKIGKGRIKYSAMCNDDGCIIDDGVIVKLRENDYYFTTSTGRAGQTVEWIRYHTRFDNWDFHLVNLTDAMGVINLSGPNARKVLSKVVDTDLSKEAFPFYGYRELMIRKTIPVRAVRLGFVGELSYELHVPSSFMRAVWDILKEAGKEFGILNFGVEAQNVLRMEKGHLILGQESEQRTNLLDVGLGFLWDRTKADAKTVGAVALRQAENDPGRLRLVGIRMENDHRPAKEGSLIVDHKIRGYVATMKKSFTLGQAVGMALVENQLAKIGTRLKIFEDECNGVLLDAGVVTMPFYDPKGKRMRG